MISLGIPDTKHPQLDRTAADTLQISNYCESPRLITDEGTALQWLRALFKIS